MATNFCRNLTGTVRSELQFKIDGFSLVSSTMAPNECIKSRWDIDGYEWEIHCYPCSYSNNWIELCLMLLSEPPRTGAVTAGLSCLVLHPRMTGSASHSQKRLSHVFKRQKDCSARLLFVQKSALPAPACPKDDYLTVQCSITILKEPVSKKTILKEQPDVATTVPVPTSNLHRHFGELLQSGTGADVTLVVAGESFAAHKAILAARSPVLMAEFFGHMRERIAQRAVIEGMEAAAFKAMLHFIYTDNVPELDGEQEATATMAQHLLEAADRYGLDRLKVICEGKLSGGITVDTAATTLALAEQHNCSHLKAKCVEFIISTPVILEAVVATEGYKHLEASCPSALTSIVLSMRGRRS